MSLRGASPRIGVAVQLAVDAAQAGEGDLAIAVSAIGLNIPTQVHPQVLQICLNHKKLILIFIASGIILVISGVCYQGHQSLDQSNLYKQSNNYVDTMVNYTKSLKDQEHQRRLEILEVELNI